MLSGGSAVNAQCLGIYVMLVLLTAGCASSPKKSDQRQTDSQTHAITDQMNTSLRNSFALFGQVKDRKIKEMYLPRYPRWAEEKGLETDVVLHFQVRPDGLVGKIEPEKQGELEELAVKALKAFVFEPLPADQPQEKQRGVMIFYFRLAGKEQ